ncbi:hypothetical protein [Pseudogracilibacillus sp. SO30301A]|uniref:hypothetical protein n=1 Tax=Pseudogracilibacillus sp. SO30301A TaxID=3098291 RepID=UPI00300E0D4C
MKKHKIFISITFMLGIVITFYFFNPFQLLQDDSSPSPKIETAINEYPELGAGFSMKVSNENIKTDSDIIDFFIMESPQDELTIFFENFYTNSEFVLNLFYDYQQIDFKVDGHKKTTNYFFELNENESISIPVILPKTIKADKSPHKLLVSIVVAPYYHEKDLKLNSDHYGIVMDYEIEYDGYNSSESFSQKPEINQPELIDLPFASALMINDDLNMNAKVANNPPHSLSVKPNEEVTLAYRAGPEENATNYLLTVLIDWKQTLINNNEPFQIINIPDSNKVGYGTFTFIAPNDPGDYELIAYLIPEPFTRKSDDLFSISSSTRFTLSVPQKNQGYHLMVIKQ